MDKLGAFLANPGSIVDTPFGDAQLLRSPEGSAVCRLAWAPLAIVRETGNWSVLCDCPNASLSPFEGRSRGGENKGTEDDDAHCPYCGRHVDLHPDTHGNLEEETRLWRTLGHIGLVVLPLRRYYPDLDCEAWTAKLAAITAKRRRAGADFNSLHKQSLDVETDFPVIPILHSLRHKIRLHFGLDTGDLRVRAAFSVHYAMDPDANRKLKKHTDDSLLTLNLCVHSDDVVGNQVRFFGTKAIATNGGGKARPTGFAAAAPPFVDVPIIDTRVCLHWGAHPHETQPLRKGERWNIIMWFVHKDTGRDPPPATIASSPP